MVFVARRYLVPCLAICIVMGSIFYSGVVTRGVAKDVDARYFYVAAKCWSVGESPYQPQIYEAAFSSTFGTSPSAVFAGYLPTIITIILPMAFFSWPIASVLFSLMNFVAAMALFWACYFLIVDATKGRLQLSSWIWLVVASTIGGVAGTIFTGQTSVFVTAAMALALVGCRLQRTLLVVIGLVICSAKPHLSGPIALFILLFEPLQRRAVAIAGAVSGAICLYAAWVDGNLLHSYTNSIRAYSAIAENDPNRQIGVVPLLQSLGIAPQACQWIAWSLLLVILVIAGRLLLRTRQPFGQNSLVVMLIVLSVGIARPIHGYDVCSYSVGIAMIAVLSRRMQLILAFPALIIWRPGILTKLHPPLAANVILSLAWLGVVVAIVVMVTYQLRMSYMLNKPGGSDNTGLT